MSKPPITRVYADDLVLVLSGAAYHPHEGEWVDLIPLQSVAELQAVSRFSRLAVEWAAAQDEPEAQADLLAKLDQHFGGLCSALAGRVVAWDWTDDAGRALPQPDGTPDPLARLRAAEIMWLLNQVQGDGEEPRKNGSRPLLTTSSDSGPVPSPSVSSGGRSRTKAS